MKKILIIFLSIFISTASAKSTDFYYFANSAISIFTDIRDAQMPLKNQDDKGEMAALKSVLRTTVYKDKVYVRVIYKLKEFEKSNHKEIRFATTVISSEIILLKLANNNISNYLENILNNQNLLMQQGTISRKLAELTEATNDSWKAYAASGGAMTFSLVDGMPFSLEDLNSKSTKATLSKLLITKSEVNLLKIHLQKSFGPVILDNNKAEFADIPAISIWNFLNDKWIPAKE